MTTDSSFLLDKRPGPCDCREYFNFPIVDVVEDDGPQPGEREGRALADLPAQHRQLSHQRLQSSLLCGGNKPR